MGIVPTVGAVDIEDFERFRERYRKEIADAKADES